MDITTRQATVAPSNATALGEVPTAGSAEAPAGGTASSRVGALTQNTQTQPAYGQDVGLPRPGADGGRPARGTTSFRQQYTQDLRHASATFGQMPTPTAKFELQQMSWDAYLSGLASLNDYPIGERYGGNTHGLTQRVSDALAAETGRGRVVNRSDPTAGAIVDARSGLNARLLIDTDTRHVTIAFGGVGSGSEEDYAAGGPSKTWLLSQWVSAIKNFFGIEARSLAQAKLLTQKVVETIQSDPQLQGFTVSTTGHSKGATEAVYAALSQREPLSVAAFASADLGRRLVSQLPPENVARAKELVRHYHVRADVVPNLRYASPTVRPLGVETVVPASPNVDSINRHATYFDHIYEYATPRLDAFRAQEELDRQAAADAAARANTYQPGSAEVDLGSVSQREADETMPLLLAEGKKKDASGRIPEARRQDVLRAKETFRATHQDLARSGTAPTTNELSAIRTFMDAGTNLNRWLGEMNGDLSKLPPEYRAEYERIKSGMDKLPDEPGTTYRGVTASPEVIERFRNSVGSVFTSPTFVSSSASADYAKEYSDNVRPHSRDVFRLRIQIIGETGKNVSGVPDLVDGIEDPTMISGSGEFLFAPNSKFRLAAFAELPEKNAYGIILKQETENVQPTRSLHDGTALSSPPSEFDGFTQDMDAFAKTMLPLSGAPKDEST